MIRLGSSTLQSSSLAGIFATVMMYALELTLESRTNETYMLRKLFRKLHGEELLPRRIHHWKRNKGVS